MVNPKMMGGKMIKKKILNPNRIRRINGGFSFVPHRFITDGFLASLEQKELLLFLFLVIVSDGTVFQVLSLPSKPVNCSLKAAECNRQPTKDPTPIADTIKQSLQGI